MKIKVYEPVCSTKNGKSWFTVNGAICEDRDEAIRRANRHTSVKDGNGKIERVDEHEVDEHEWNNPRIY